MVTPVTGIVADLQLQSAAFIRDLEKASRAVATNTSAMNRSIKSLQSGFALATKALGAYVSLAAGRQLLAFTNDIINNAAAIKEQAQAVGLSTDELQEFRVAGERAGVAVATMDKSLGIFVKNLGQAKVGTGPLVSSLKDTNKELLLSLQNATSAGQALEILFEEIKAAPNEFERARLAQSAFSKGWREMVLLAQEDTPEARKRFQELGLTIRNDVIEQADELQDTMRDLQRAFENGFTTGLVDAFNKSLSTTEENLIKAKDVGALFGTQVGESFKDIATFFTTLNSLVENPSWSNLWENLKPLFDFSKVEISQYSTLGYLRWLAEQLGTFQTLQQTIVAAIQLKSDWLNKAVAVVEWLKGNQGFFERVQQPIFPQGDTSFPNPNPHGLKTRINPRDIAPTAEDDEAWRSNAKAIGEWDTEVTDALGRTLSNMEQIKSEGINMFADSQTAMESYSTSLERLDFLFQQGAIDAQTFARQHQQLTLGMAQNWLGAAGAVTGALSQIFKDNKAFAVADAVVNTAAAIVAALKNPPGPPFSFVYAAAAAAAGAAQIATILSAQPGKGKAPSVSGSGKTVKATKSAGDSSSSSNSGGETLKQIVTINVTGDSFGPEHFKKMVDGLNGVIRDGAVLKVA